MKTCKRLYSQKTKEDLVNKIHKYNINTVTMVIITYKGFP